MRRSAYSGGEALKPIGIALSAVMAGLAGGAAFLESEPLERAYADADSQADVADETDESLILGPSAPVEPLGAPAPVRQLDLFEL